MNSKLFDIIANRKLIKEGNKIKLEGHDLADVTKKMGAKKHLTGKLSNMTKFMR